MNRYNHFTIEELEKARCLLEQGLSIRAIARILKRSPFSVSREFKRNRYKNGDYAAHHVQKLYSKRKQRCGKTPKLSDEIIKNYVLERMELRWTPEQICERAKLEKQPFSLSFATIYRAIDNGVLPRKLKKIMRFKWKYKKRKASDKRGKIQNTISIHDRPQTVNDRDEVGHWESDTVLGKRRTGCLGTHVERVSVYFCDPHSPWQRGTNENTNGLLRQFFPKGTFLANVSQDELNSVINLINNRPRKRLGCKTPAEFINSFLQKCCT